MSAIVTRCGVWPFPEADSTPSRRAQSVRQHSAPKSRVDSYLQGKLPFWSLSRLEERVDLAGCRLIGTGSFGTVVLARDRVTGADFAVKVVCLDTRGAASGAEDAVRREVQALQAVRHRNIVELVEVFQTAARIPGVTGAPPYFCLALRYVPNPTPLAKIIREGMELKEVRRVLSQLCAALMELHNKGFVHRDVWSDNVLIDGSGQAVLIDLGCAASYTAGPDMDPLKDALNVPYMSPQASALERQQPGDDCWALGCVLSEMAMSRLIIDWPLGDTTRPLHSLPGALQSCIDATCRADMTLGDLAKRLLDRNAKTRLSMRSLCPLVVVEVLKDSLRAHANSKSAMMLPVKSFHSRRRAPSINSQSGQGSPSAGVASPQASPAVAWPLFPSGLSTSQRSSPAALRSPWPDVSWGLPRDMSPMRTKMRSSPGQGQQPPQLSNRPVDTPVMRRSSRQSTPPNFAGVVSSLPSPPAAQSVRLQPRALDPEAHRIALAPGVRVIYRARTHEGEYPAVVVGPERGGKAWRVLLDTGDHKVIEDSELWRLQRAR